MNSPNIEIYQEHGYRNQSCYYTNRHGQKFGFYLGQYHNEASLGTNNWTSAINHELTIGNVYGNIRWFTERILEDTLFYKSRSNGNTPEIVTKYSLEFDKTAKIIGYIRNENNIDEMFREQRQVLIQQRDGFNNIRIQG